MVQDMSPVDVKRLQALMRHVEGVQRDCEIIAQKLIADDDFVTGKRLIVLGRLHDASKFDGIEWEHLGVPGDPMHEEAWLHHVTSRNNRHHPEAWGGGIHAMEDVFIAEMVCDWHSRAAEFGSDLRSWIKGNAMPRFGFDVDDKIYCKIKKYVDLLLEPSFV